MSTFARSLTISISNASGADFSLTFSTLTGGSWATPPQNGTVISSGDTKTYENGLDNTLKSLGGTIVLVPAGGGLITLTWNWPAGGQVSGSADSQGVSGVGTSVNFSNTATEHPSMQVLITNSAAFEALSKAAHAAI